MAQTLTKEEEQALAGFNRPVPGQSLTNSPDQPYPWEQKAEFNNVFEAQMHIFTSLIEKSAFVKVTEAMAQGVPVDILTKTILFDGYSRGLWNADLLMLLIEPVAVILMALAEKVGVDYILYQGDQDDHEEDPEIQKQAFNKMNAVQKALADKIKNGTAPLDKGSVKLSQELQQALEAIPQQEVEEVQEEVKQKSLLER
jgi:hypothetical protein